MSGILYIIGNGFDLHHRVPSSLWDFREWLMVHEPALYRVYERVCSFGNRWQDFEASMAYVDRDFLLGEGEMFLETVSNECLYAEQPLAEMKREKKSSARWLMSHEVSAGTAEEMLRLLKQALHKWVRSLRVPSCYKDLQLPLHREADYLTFNYTPFLETEYGIDKGRVLHLHGQRSQSYRQLVVGHGDEVKLPPEVAQERYFFGKLKDFSGNRHLADGLECFVRDSRKPVEKVISRNAAYFNALSQVREVHVLGFSFAPVDLPYIRHILAVNEHPDSLTWHVGFHESAEEHLFQTVMQAMGIPKQFIDMKPFR